MGRLVWFGLVLAACGSRGGDPSTGAAPHDAGVAASPIVPIPAPPPYEVPPPADKLIGIGRGLRHACVVRASGAVDCWGDLKTPGRITGIDDAVGVTADARCFIRKGGTVACLGEGTVAVEPLEGVTDAKAADNHSRCFLVGAGSVTCLDDDHKAWTVPNLRDAIALSSSQYSVCAVRKTGDVACGSSSVRTPFVPLRGVDHVTEIVLAGRFDAYACAATNGHVRCFALAAFVEPGQPLIAKEKDEDHSYALKDAAVFDGATQLAMWMAGGSGEQFVLEAIVGGVIRRTDFQAHDVVPRITDATLHIAECAIRAQGSLVCWGQNAGGVLAQPTTLGQSSLPPRTVVGIGDIADIALGLTKSFALTRDGRLYWWGRDGFEIRSTPTSLPLGLGPAKLVQLTADRHDHPCMRSADGDVWCLAANGRIEQLDTQAIRDIQASNHVLLAFRADARVEVHAIGAAMSSEAPMTVADLGTSDVVQVGDLRDVLCALHRDGTVTCPGRIPDLKAATALASGWSHACAVQRGRVWCWISGDVGIAMPPREIPGLRDVTDLASSANYACAVHDHGKVSCWHYEEKRTDDRLVYSWLPPVQLLAEGAIDVELGFGTADQYRQSQTTLDGPQAAGEYGCALLGDRTMKCWGMNLFGELGDASYREALEPIGVKL